VIKSQVCTKVRQQQKPKARVAAAAPTSVVVNVPAAATLQHGTAPQRCTNAVRQRKNQGETDIDTYAIGDTDTDTCSVATTLTESELVKSSTVAAVVHLRQRTRAKSSSSDDGGHISKSDDGGDGGGDAAAAGLGCQRVTLLSSVQASGSGYTNGADCMCGPNTDESETDVFSVEEALPAHSARPRTSTKPKKRRTSSTGDGLSIFMKKIRQLPRLLTRGFSKHSDKRRAATPWAAPREIRRQASGPVA
jgi:hypothetical protein